MTKRNVDKSAIIAELRKLGLTVKRTTVGTRRVWQLSNGKIAQSLSEVLLVAKDVKPHA